MKLALLFILASCASATMVQSPKNKPAYAPSGYIQKGMVKYLNQGASSVVNSRREDAFEKMSKECGGDYKITHEGPSNDGYFTSAAAGGLMTTSSEYMFIEFTCDSKTAFN
jgi:hypothetical protein